MITKPTGALSPLPSPDPRARVINFRLSEREYECVLHACRTQSVRSVSEFARDSVLCRARGDVVTQLQFGPWLVNMKSDFDKMKADLGRLLQLVSSLTPKRP